MTARRLGRFELLDQIGLSSTAEIFTARPTNGGETVAIKRLLPHALDDPAIRARFDHEIHTALKNTHPGLVRGLEVVEGPTSDGRAGDKCLVMALVRGTPLIRLLGREEAPAEAIAHVATSLASNLAALHCGPGEIIAHGDVSARNIIASDDGGFTVLDLGSAAPDGTSATDTGTPRYTPPERVEGGPITTRGDIYAVGVLLWELAAGRRWTKQSPQSTVPDVSLVAGTGIAELIERCISADPAGRPNDAAALLGECAALGVHTGRSRQTWRRWAGCSEEDVEAEMTDLQGLMAWAGLVGALGIALWTTAWFVS